MVIIGCSSSSSQINEYRIVPFLVNAAVSAFIDTPGGFINSRKISCRKIEFQITSNIIFKIVHPAPFKIFFERWSNFQIRVIYISCY